MLLQAAINGDLTKPVHPGVPLNVDEIVRDAVACIDAGANGFHIHPHDSEGQERLDPEIVDHVVTKVREVCRVPIGVTTGAWIEPDVDRRVALVRRWRAPDSTTVNVSEEGAKEIMQALIQAGIGIEAGVWTVEDAERLATFGLSNQLLRICVEPGMLQIGGPESTTDTRGATAVAFVADIHRALDKLGLTAPRLQHGDGEVTWVLLEDAVRRGVDTRIGLEDTLYEPGGERTAGNAALVRAARRLGAGAR